MKLYPVLHCGQVKVYRKIYFSSLTTMYSMYSKGWAEGEGEESRQTTGKKHSD